MMYTGNKMLHPVVVAMILAAALLSSVSMLHAGDSDGGSDKTPVKADTADKPVPAAENSSQNRKIRIQLHWYPQAQFAGYLMAVEKGFFKAEGLDVELQWGQADILPLTELREGRVEFCTAWLSQAIASRTNDNTPCVLLAQLMSRSSMMLVARKTSGIETPAQMNGKKIGIWGGDFSIAPTAFFEKYSIKPIVITQSSSVLPFVKGVVDVASAMYYNEYHKIMEAGIKEDELTTFMLADYGLDFPEDGIYTTEDFRKAHPETCEKVLRAIQKGWQYSFLNKEETIKAIVSAATENKFITNANHQRWMIETMEKLIPTKVSTGQTWGYLAESTYDNVCNILKHQKLLKNSPPPYNEFYQPPVAENRPQTSTPKSEGGEAK